MNTNARITESVLGSLGTIEVAILWIYLAFPLRAVFETDALRLLAECVAKGGWRLDQDSAKAALEHAKKTILYENSGIYDDWALCWNRYRVLMNVFAGEMIPADSDTRRFFIGVDTVFEIGLYLSGRLVPDAVLRPTDYPGRFLVAAERELSIGCVHAAAMMLGGYSRFGERDAEFKQLVDRVRERLGDAHWLVPIYVAGGEWPGLTNLE